MRYDVLEKPEERQFQSAIENAVKETGFHVIEWSIYADDEKEPAGYTLFIETDPPISFGQASYMCEILEEDLEEESLHYRQEIREGHLRPLRLEVLQPQTYQLYRELLSYKGITDDQLISSHKIDRVQNGKFFFALIEDGRVSHISESARRYKRSGIGTMLRLGSNYSNVVNLCNGEPDFDTPSHIVDAACDALRAGMTKYVPEQGILSFQESVAGKYTSQFGFKYEPQDCIATLGSSEAAWLSLATLLNPGDEVIIPDPAYNSYELQINSLHAVPVKVPLREEHDFHLDANELEACITPRTKAVLLNYPSNPVGSVLKREDAEKLSKVIRKHDLMVISDEVYESLVFDGRKHFSIAQIPGMADHTIIINSLSKAFAMTGWRIGFAVCKDRQIIQTMATIQQTVATAPPAFIMHAAAAAISGPQDCVEEMRKQFEIRRDILYKGLSEIPGMKPFHTEGSFCTFINIKAITGRYSITSDEFSSGLLKHGKVISVPGSTFGPMGEGYLRLCFANSDEMIREGVRRIKKFTMERYPVEYNAACE